MCVCATLIFKLNIRRWPTNLIFFLLQIKSCTRVNRIFSFNIPLGWAHCIRIVSLYSIESFLQVKLREVLWILQKEAIKSLCFIMNKSFYTTNIVLHAFKIFCNRNFKYKIGFPITWLDQSFNRLTEMVNYLLKVPYVPKLIP